MPRSMHLHTEIYPNLKSISELFKMYMKSLDSFILASRDTWVRATRHSALTEIVEFLDRSLWDMAAAWLAVGVFLASCFKINVFFFTNLDKLFF